MANVVLLFTPVYSLFPLFFPFFPYLPLSSLIFPYLPFPYLPYSSQPPPELRRQQLENLRLYKRNLLSYEVAQAYTQAALVLQRYVLYMLVVLVVQLPVPPHTMIIL